MSLIIDVATVQWIHLALLIAFSICFALLLPLTRHSGLRYWLGGSLLVGVATPLFIWRGEGGPHLLTFLVPTSLAVAATGLKWLAVLPPLRRPRASAILLTMLLLFVPGYHALDLLGWDSARLAASLLVIAALSACIAIDAVRNPRWQKIAARFLIAAPFGLTSATLIIRAAHVLGGGGPADYFSQGHIQSAAFVVNLISLIVTHIGLMALGLGRIARLRARRQIRRRAQAQRRRQAEAHARATAALAAERHALLEILTHEVRQPLNNAQAALQEIADTIGGDKLEASRTGLAVSRLYDILDGVVLALSNAIIGATVIERQGGQPLQPVDLAAVAELARGDCPVSAAGRLRLTAGRAPLFAAADPVLVRLAFRNLLDNALKFSPPGSIVTARLYPDRRRLGVVFEVTNEVSGPFAPSNMLFERARRGDVQVAGRGLGLFIVREAARLHCGSASAGCDSQGRARFEMFLPV